MYTIIGFPRTRATRVIWLAEEIGLDYTIDPARPGSDEARTVTGTGKVPALKTPDGVIPDSVAAMTYLADKYGKFTHPAGTFARGYQDAMTQFIVAEIDAALWLAAKHSFALPKEDRLPEVKPTAQKEFARYMAHLATVKGDKPYLAGDAPTIPDFLLSHCAGWAMNAKFPLPEGPFRDYLKSMAKRPAQARVKEIVTAHL